jgi:hypothetical protein
MTTLAFLTFAFIAGALFDRDLLALRQRLRRRRTVREIERQAVTEAAKEEA